MDLNRIAPWVIAGISLCFGIWKDLKLRAIEKRKNGPHFEAEALLIDCGQISYTSGALTQYHYNKKPSAMDGRLLEMTGAKILRSDYPDGLIAGIRVRNSGAHIRYYKISSRRPITFAVPSNDPDCFVIQYRYSRNLQGSRIKFAIKFENAEGYKGRQVWEVVIGERSIRRKFPRPN
jgi:hypothetical protein